MKRVAAFLILLTMIPVPAYSLIFGASPNTKDLCLVPGDTANTIYTVSSASNKTEVFDVYVMNLSWVQANTWVEVPSMSGVPMEFYIDTEGVPEGMYSTDILYCIEPVVASIPVKSCVKAELHVNVSYACSPNEYAEYLEAKQQRETLYFGLIGAFVAIIVAFFVLRQLSSIKKKKK